MKQVVIIGGGPSGMMAAISTKLHHPQAQVTLLERNDSLGVKMKLSGGGRCNVSAMVSTKEVIENIVKNGKFLYSSIEEFGPQEIKDFFEVAGCPLKEEDHHRLFPQSNNAKDIVDTLLKQLHALDVRIVYHALVQKVEEKAVFVENCMYPYDRLILATGGKTYQHTGSDGSGYDFAKFFSHTVTELSPCEVPLLSNDEVIVSKELQGVSLQDVNLKVMRNKKVIKAIQHDVLFTHFGLSGPGALRASYFVRKELQKDKQIKLLMDCLPEYSLDDLLIAYNEEGNRAQVFHTLPKRLLKYAKEHTNGTQDYLNQLKNFPIHIYDTKGFSTAFVTSGGVMVKEIDPKTMKSKRNPNISFCGELMDVNAYTGGYNITVALSSGYRAGKYVLD